MSTIHPSSATNSRDNNNNNNKGIRRPFGPINVNRAEEKANPSIKPAVVKPTASHQRKLSSQSLPSEPVSSSSAASLPRSNSSTIATTTTTSRGVDSHSIFRDYANIDENTDPRSDLLTLKRANPVLEAPEEEQDDVLDNNEEDDLSFPFTRVDQTIVYEPYDTMQLRSIFRRPFLQTSDLDDRLEKEGLALRLANAISELDNDDQDSLLVEEQDSLPSLLSATSDNSSRTQALEWRGLVSETTAILDLIM